MRIVVCWECSVGENGCVLEMYCSEVRSWCVGNVVLVNMVVCWECSVGWSEWLCAKNVVLGGENCGCVMQCW